MENIRNKRILEICGFKEDEIDISQLNRKEDIEYEIKIAQYLKEKHAYNEAMKQYDLQMEEYKKVNPDFVKDIEPSKPASPIQKRAVNPHTMIPDGLNISVKRKNEKADLITKLFGL